MVAKRKGIDGGKTGGRKGKIEKRLGEGYGRSKSCRARLVHRRNVTGCESCEKSSSRRTMKSVAGKGGTSEQQEKEREREVCKEFPNEG